MTNDPNNAVPPTYDQPASNQPGSSSNAYSQPGPSGQKKTLSLISMIAGILGVLAIFTTWPAVILGIAAVILGHLGQRRERVAGKGFWITGLITGYIAIVGGIIWLIAILVFAAAVSNGDFGNIPTY